MIISGNQMSFSLIAVAQRKTFIVEHHQHRVAQADALVIDEQRRRRDERGAADASAEP